MEEREVPGTASGNVEMAAAWDAQAQHWLPHADRHDRSTWRHWERFMSAVAFAPDEAVLDIGCGSGAATRAVARRVHEGSVLGIDVSARMLERASEAARAEGVRNVRFEQGDAQVHPFPAAAFDRAISLFGGMFFADPTAAFANVRRALRPGGRLAMLAWRELGRNEWVSAVHAALSSVLPLPPPAAGSPGPFGLADPGIVRDVLGSAGYVDVSLESIDEPMELGSDADDTLAFLQTFGMTRSVMQRLPDPARADARDTLRRMLVEHETSSGVLLGASAWLITAVAPEGGT